MFRIELVEGEPWISEQTAKVCFTQRNSNTMRRNRRTWAQILENYPNVIVKRL